MAAGSAQPLEQSLRQATVLAVLMGPASADDDDGLEGLSQVASRLEQARELLVRRGGDLVWGSPMGLLAIYPEDGAVSGALRAVDAARALRALLEVEGLSVGLGLASGPVGVGAWSGGGLAVGAAVDEARSLAGSPGELRVSEGVAARLARHVTLTREGGVARVVHTHDAQPIAPSVGGFPLPFTGRGEELTEALTFVGDVMTQGGHGILRVRAAPGVGTTRFLSELGARAVAAYPAMRVLGGAVAPTELGDADLVARVGLEAARVRNADSHDVAVRRVQRWLGGPLHLAETLVRMARGGSERVAAQERVESVAGALDGLRSPALLVLDGAVEVATLRHALAARQSRAALILVLAGPAVSEAAFAAPTPLAEGSTVSVAPAEPTHTQWQRDLSLEPLSVERLESLVHNALAAAQDVPRWIVRELARVAEGSPLVVDELLLDLEARGVIDTSARPWRIQPAPIVLGTSLTTEHLSLGRLDRLPLKARRAAEAAALLAAPPLVGGGTSTPGGVTADALRALGVGDAQARIDELVDGGVLRAQRGEWCFVRPALVGLLLRALSPRRARRLHLAAAESLAARAVGDEEGRVAWAVARHLSAAGQAERAWPYADRAAAALADGRGEAETLARCEAALHLAERVAPAHEVARCCIRWGEQLRRAGQLEASERQLRRGLQEAHGLPELVAAASVGLGWLLEHRGQLAPAQQAFTAALAAADYRREALVGLAAVAVKTGHLDEARQRLLEADTAPPSLGSESARLESTRERLRGHVHLRAGDRHLAEAAYALAERRAVEAGAAEEQVDALNGLGALHFFAGDLSRAELVFGQALQAAARWDLVHVEGYVLTNLSEVLLAQGRHADAAERLQIALARHQALQNDEGVAEAGRLLAEARHALGQREDARVALSLATHAAARVGSAYALGEVARVERLLSTE